MSHPQVFTSDTEANWTSLDPVLALDEYVVSSDKYRYKVGDGIHQWSATVYEPGILDANALGRGLLRLSSGFGGGNALPSPSENLIAAATAAALAAVRGGVGPALDTLDELSNHVASWFDRHLPEQDSMDELLPLIQEKGMSVIAGGVYNSGLLIDPTPGAMYNYAPAPEHVLVKAGAIRDVYAGFDVPIRAAALQFTLAHPAIATAVVGARTPAEVDDNLAMAALPIPPELWTALKERDLMRPDAPVPD